MQRSYWQLRVEKIHLLPKVDVTVWMFASVRTGRWLVFSVSWKSIHKIFFQSVTDRLKREFCGAEEILVVQKYSAKWDGPICRWKTFSLSHHFSGLYCSQRGFVTSLCQVESWSLVPWQSWWWETDECFGRTHIFQLISSDLVVNESLTKLVLISKVMCA